MIYNKVFVKIGELLHGKLDEETTFLVSSHTSARFNAITVIEKHTYPGLRLRQKSQEALIIFLLFHEGMPPEVISAMSEEERKEALKRKVPDYFTNIRISQTTNIPRGKGLCSDAAEVLGLLDLLNTFFQSGYPPDQLYRLAAIAGAAAPSFSGAGLLFDQSKGLPLEQFSLPQFSLVFFDSDRNRTTEPSVYRELLFRTDPAAYVALLDDFRQAASNGGTDAFLEAVTRSAELSHAIFPRPGFELLRSFAFTNGCGVFVAHSGSFMGLVVPSALWSMVAGQAEVFITENWKSVVYHEKGALCGS